MQRICLSLIVQLSVLFCLAGCAVSPVTYGISEAKWKQMTVAQQKKIRHDAKILQLQRKQQRQQFAQQREQQVLQTKVVAQGLGHQLAIPGAGKQLRVELAGGTLLMPPRFDRPVAFTKTTTFLRDWQCRQLQLLAKNAPQHTRLRLCYYHHTLYIDPSEYELTKQPGTLRAHDSPLWQAGLQYQHLYSTGYTRLSDVTLTVQWVPLSDAG